MPCRPRPSPRSYSRAAPYGWRPRPCGPSRAASNAPSAIGQPPKITASTQAGRKPIQGLDRRPVDAYLEVQVVPGRGAGRADQPDDLAPVHVLADRHEDLGLVPVAGGQALPLV